MTTYAAYNAGLPCQNPDCKSHGTPHPNCQCYGEYAKGGEVGPFCSAKRAHQKGCEYFADGGEAGDEDEADAEAPEEEEPQDESPEALEPEEAPAASADLSPKLPATEDKGYNAAADSSKVDAARAAEKDAVSRANVSHGLSQMLMAGSAANGGPGASEADYKTQLAQAHTPVAQAEADRQQQIKDYLTQQNLGRQAEQDQQKKALSDQQLAGGDPDSKDSQVGRAAFKANFPKIAAAMGDDFDNLSMNNLGKISTMVGAKAKLDAATHLAAANAVVRQDKAKAAVDAASKKTATGDLKDLGKDLDTETASSRSGLGVANSKIDSANRLLTFADINPNSPEDMAALKASKTDPKAKAALTAKMNALSPQQYTEIVSGLMSQINPGGGSLGQLEHLRADTASQTKANLMQYFTSHPQDAGMGEMIVNNLQTLANERDTSQAVVDKHNARMKAKHPAAFAHPDTADQASAMLDSFGKAPEPEAAPPQGTQGVASSPAPHGQTVKQGDHTFTWNGSKYVPASSVAVGGN